MKCAILALGVVSALAIVACNPFTFNRIAGSGHLVTTNYDLTGFQSIDASGAFEVKIQPGDHFAVSITTDDNLLDRLVVTRDGSWLRLGVKPGNISSTRLEASVTMPSLTSITASGATKLEFGSFKMDDFRAEASGASQIKGEIHAKQSELECSGASEISFLGDASSITVKGSGASHLDCAHLMSNSGDVELSGASDAHVNTTDSLNYDVSGASHLKYSGSPRIGHAGCSGASGVDHT